MSVNVKILFIIFLYSNSLVLSQTKPVLKDFPFGKFWYYEKLNEDGSRPPTDKEILDSGVVYENKVFNKFHGFINQNLIQALLHDNTLTRIWLYNVDIDALGIFYTNIDKYLEVSSSNIGTTLWFSNSEIQKPLIIHADVNGTFILGDSVQFDDNVSFGGCKFKLGGSIFNIVAKSTFDFRGIVDTTAIYLTNCQFYSRVFFDHSRFNNIEISNCNFYQSFHFSDVKSKTISLTKNVFKDTIDFSNCYFEKGVDLRRNNFDSVNVLHLEGFEYPNGKLYVYWDSICAKDNPRISLKEFSNDKADDYKRLTKIYEKLRDNYLGQDNKQDADGVMYELAVHKSILFPSIWHSFYRFSLGFGYKPFRFLVFLFIPVLFAVIWYFWYYGHVLLILYNNNINKWSENFNNELKTRKIIIYKYAFEYFNHECVRKDVYVAARWLHVFIISFAFLIGIRFKKDWSISITNYAFGKRIFLVWVFIEWLIGKVLFIYFILYILSFHFSTFKGFYGF